ncbi:aromatic-ring-hydroxylating dioxygenase subunit beta [Chachezhania sediminis]|uniref:aromatic-ring-hydroxylating dioxygenase subunit beta n=1 Tax=Chachezhania sediminis TaxID=2599291 RepID=UPI00131B3BF5|nr:aromatic-ring-hydroxylating dioxygenase subunit beta [Chachezhania sediminis]
MIDLETRARVQDFLFEEARRLDAGEFEAWLDLYEEDGIYWMPSQRGQTDPLNVASIIYEDHAILSIRVQRLLEARALVLTPMPYTTHLVTNVVVSMDEDGLVKAASAFLCISMQGGEQKIFAGRQTHTLAPAGDSYLIRHKRVDLVNAGSALPLMTIPI